MSSELGIAGMPVGGRATSLSDTAKPEPAAEVGREWEEWEDVEETEVEREWGGI